MFYPAEPSSLQMVLVFRSYRLVFVDAMDVVSVGATSVSRSHQGAVIFVTGLTKCVSRSAFSGGARGRNYLLMLTPPQ